MLPRHRSADKLIGSLDADLKKVGHRTRCDCEHEACGWQAESGIQGDRCRSGCGALPATRAAGYRVAGRNRRHRSLLKRVTSSSSRERVDNYTCVVVSLESRATGRVGHAS